MNLWIFSDLHQDFGKFDLPIPDNADIAIAAGDIQNDGLLASLGNKLPTIFVAGNHEFYGHCYGDRMDELRGIPSEQLYVMHNESVVFGNVRFVAATLWTDYNRHNPIAMDLARRSMNDHRKIKWSKEPWMRFRPEEAAALHADSVRAIEAVLAAPHDGPTVIVTHHAPSEQSVAAKYRGDTLNYAYFSDLDWLIEKYQPELWVHGHVHSSFDYTIGKTRVLCNPHGYPGENKEFDPSLVVKA